jgi:hypothetical protein
MAQVQTVVAPVDDDVIPELVVKEGEDIDYRVVLGAYLLADLGVCVKIVILLSLFNDLTFLVG